MSASILLCSLSCGLGGVVQTSAMSQYLCSTCVLGWQRAGTCPAVQDPLGSVPEWKQGGTCCIPPVGAARPREGGMPARCWQMLPPCWAHPDVSLCYHRHGNQELVQQHKPSPKSTSTGCLQRHDSGAAQSCLENSPAASWECQGTRKEQQGPQWVTEQGPQWVTQQGPQWVTLS